MGYRVQLFKILTAIFVAISFILMGYSIYVLNLDKQNDNKLTFLKGKLDSEFLNQIGQVKVCFSRVIDDNEYLRCVKSVSAATEIAQYSSFAKENALLYITLEDLSVALSQTNRKQKLAKYSDQLRGLFQRLMENPTDLMVTKELAKFSSDLLGSP